MFRLLLAGAMALGLVAPAVAQDVQKPNILAIWGDDIGTWNISPRNLGLIVHDDDAAREFAYDPDSHIGKLARGLDEADARGWLVVSMKDDWKTVFPETP